ncbi:MAG: hypothetical protein K5841_01885 [Fretibacterium sp.]|nr:hypothetical protein [Fretibacterium sp.]
MEEMFGGIVDKAFSIAVSAFLLLRFGVVAGPVPRGVGCAGRPGPCVRRCADIVRPARRGQRIKIQRGPRFEVRVSQIFPC